LAHPDINPTNTEAIKAYLRGNPPPPGPH